MTFLRRPRWRRRWWALTAALGVAAGCAQIADITSFSPATDGGGSQRLDAARVDATSQNDGGVVTHHDATAHADAGKDVGVSLPDVGVSVDADGAMFPSVNDAGLVIYVWADAASGGDGSLEHPFQTIQEGLGDGGFGHGAPVTVALAAGMYDTTVNEGALVVFGNFTLEGAGPDAVILTGESNNPCSPKTDRCTLLLNGGATLTGVTVVGSPADGVTALGDAASIYNVRVLSAGASNIVAVGNLRIGPGVSSTNATQNGLDVAGAATVVWSVGTPTNSFDDNSSDGIWVHSGVLIFQGGSVSGNVRVGINFVSPAEAGTVENAEIHRNGSGIVVTSPGLHLVVRGSDLTQNGVGLQFDYGASPRAVLDLGTDGGLAGVRFGTGDAGHPDASVGLLLCDVPADAGQPVHGVTFQTCPPSAVQTACTLTGLTGYKDIGYSSATNPLSCSCEAGVCR
jgi:hypothetical protein